MRQTLAEYCTQNGKEYLLEQWSKEKNEGLMPEEVSFGSNRKVWWKCSAGHEWQSTVWSRTSRETGCPYCTNMRVIPENSFADVAPELVAQWHPAKNGQLKPTQVSSGSHRIVWWICDKGHEWRAAVKTRISGCGCPVCANKTVLAGANDLATTHPQLADQWHPTKNLSLKPEQVLAGSSRKVWWQCENGHEWLARISARARGSGCPICGNRLITPDVNDLASAYPYLAAQWLQDKNGTLRPEQVAIGSNQKVWWKCEKGHEWFAAICRRTMQGSGCPYCNNKRVLAGFNDLQTLMPEIAKEWHTVLNGKLTPDQVTVGSTRRVWWQCPYGHIWKAVVSSRTGKQKTGCPVCAGRINQAKQRYYEEIEKEAVAKKLLAEIRPEELWTTANSPHSLTGKTFGRWTVLDKVIEGKKGSKKWLCRCQCGTEKYVTERHLLECRSQSCGCLRIERARETLIQDLTGMQFGGLVVVKMADTPAGKKGAWWTCRCTCGKQVDYSARVLNAGKRRDCGCKQKGKDLSNNRFGQLTALYPTEKRGRGGEVIWHCRCDCGKEVDVLRSKLTKGSVMSCGCNQVTKKMKDLTGQRFGHLTVLSATNERTKQGLAIWRCRCDCGKEIQCVSTQLLHGKVVSCGCEKSITDWNRSNTESESAESNQLIAPQSHGKKS